MMAQTIFTALLLCSAALAAFMAALATIGGLQASRKIHGGILHYFFYALVFSNALIVLGWDRQYSELSMTQNIVGESGGAFGNWAVRLTSLYMMLASIDQITRYFRGNPRIAAAQAVLFISFFIFWATGTVIPGSFSAHTESFQLSWAYTLIFTSALLTLTEEQVETVILVFRNSIVIICSASLLMILVKPGMVLDPGYTAGYIPGVPRLAGLTPHPVAMGLYASLGMWCLIVKPINRSWLGKLAWASCLVALFLAQAKTMTLVFMLGVPILLYYRIENFGLKKKKLGELNVFYGLIIACAGFLLIVFFAYLLFGNWQDKLQMFTESKNGASMLTLTGRDKIWALTTNEWRDSPVFGYGLSLFDDVYRAKIHMPNATSGHNQIYDALGRTGTVGVIGNIIYIAVLIFMGFRYARASSGFSVVLMLCLIIRGISELSIGIRGLTAVDATQYLLTAVLVSAILKTHRLKARKVASNASPVFQPRHCT